MSDTLAIVAAAGFTAAASIGSVWVTSAYTAKRDRDRERSTRSATMFDLRRQAFESLVAVTYEMLATSNAERESSTFLAQLGSAYATVQMLTGRIETANAATALNDAALDLELAVSEQEATTYDERIAATKAARDAFVAECRRDLDLWIDKPIDEPAQPPPLTA